MITEAKNAYQCRKILMANLPVQVGEENTAHYCKIAYCTVYDFTLMTLSQIYRITLFINHGFANTGIFGKYSMCE